MNDGGAPTERSASNIVAEAYQHFKEGRFEEAIRILKRADSETAEILHLKGLALYQLGQVDAACESLVRALTLDHFDPAIALNLANMYRVRQMSHGALKLVDRVLEEYPDHPHAHRLMAELAADEQAWKKACEHWEAAHKAGLSLSRDMALSWAECRMRSGDAAGAARLLLALLGQFPEEPEIRRAAALALLASGETVKALPLLEEVWQKRADDVELGLALSAAHAQLGQDELARQITEKTLARQCWFVASGSEQSPTVGVIASLVERTLDIDGKGQLRLNGGHFLTRDLLSRETCRTIRIYMPSEPSSSAWQWPACQVLINTISDPDIEGVALERLRLWRSEHPDVPLINEPEAVLRTSRDENARRISSALGIRFPRTARIVRNGHELQQLDDVGLDYPCLLRVAGTQTGTSFEKVTSREHAEAYLRQHEGELYAIEYIDLAVEPGVYRRFRLIFVDGKAYPSTCLFNDHWNVHSINRSGLMSRRTDLQEMEQDFLHDPQKHLGESNYKALCRLPEIMGLDYFGCDFGLSSTGELVIFEANASINHNFDSVGKFPYLEPHLQRITRAFTDMVLRRCR